MKMNKKALSILLAGATVASVVVASTASASAVYEDFETEGATYGVIGDFNTWEGDVALTDEDGDGLYTATVSVPVPEEGASSTYFVQTAVGIIAGVQLMQMVLQLIARTTALSQKSNMARM